MGIFRSCLFVCQRVSRFQMVVLLYLGVVSQFFIKRVARIFWLTFSGVQVSEFVCQGFVVRGFQTVNLFVKAVEVFIGSVYCQRFSTVNLLKMLKYFFRLMSFVCQRILWFRYWKVSSCAVYLSEVLVSKGFVRSCFLVFVGLQFVLVSSGSQHLSEFGCQVLFFFSFCGFTVCIREFLQVLYVCQSLGVRALLRILLLGVSEVSRFNMSQDFFGFGLSV